MPRNPDNIPYFDPRDFWWVAPNRGGRVYPGAPLGPKYPNEPARPPPINDRGTIVELPEPLPPSTPRPDDAFLPPVKIPVLEPPVVGPGPGATPSPGGGSIADALPRQRLPVSGPRVAPGVLAAVRDLSIAGVLSWVWALAFGPSIGTFALPEPRPAGRGPPRRRARVVDTATPPAPRGYLDRTTPRSYPGLPPWLRPNILVPLPETIDAPINPRHGRRTLPTRPRTVPGGSSTVSPVLAPAGWTLGDPIVGPGYDPFTWAPPSAQPRAPGQPFPREQPVDFPWPASLPFAPRGTGRPRPTPRTRTPLTEQPLPRPAPTPTLTPFDEPVPRSQPQPRPQPYQANPCTAQRTERRRRQRDCKKFTTKTIRVCAEK